MFDPVGPVLIAPGVLSGPALRAANVKQLLAVAREPPGEEIQYARCGSDSD